MSVTPPHLLPEAKIFDRVREKLHCCLFGMASSVKLKTKEEKEQYSFLRKREAKERKKAD